MKLIGVMVVLWAIAVAWYLVEAGFVTLPPAI